MASWSEILGWVGLAVGAYYGNPAAGQKAGQTVGGFIDDPDDAWDSMKAGGTGGKRGTSGGGGRGQSGLSEMQDMVNKQPGMTRGNPDWWLPLDTNQEDSFLKWYSEYARRTGLDPNPDDPAHHYNYRALWRARETDPRFEPTLDPEDGRYHASSLFKSYDHPNRYIERDGARYDTILERYLYAPR